MKTYTRNQALHVLRHVLEEDTTVANKYYTRHQHDPQFLIHDIQRIENMKKQDKNRQFTLQNVHNIYRFVPLKSKRKSINYKRFKFIVNQVHWSVQTLEELRLQHFNFYDAYTATKNIDNINPLSISYVYKKELLYNTKAIQQINNTLDTDFQILSHFYKFTRQYKVKDNDSQMLKAPTTLEEFIETLVKESQSLFDLLNSLDCVYTNKYLIPTKYFCHLYIFVDNTYRFTRN